MRDQESEDAPSGRTGSDPLLLIGIEPGGDELGQGCPLVIEDTEGPVTGVGHRSPLFDDVAEEAREIQITLEKEGGLEQPTQFGWILYRAVGHTVPSGSGQLQFERHDLLSMVAQHLVPTM
jgi:hypothetical protein